jgi:hypothetical protein
MTAMRIRRIYLTAIVAAAPAAAAAMLAVFIASPPQLNADPGLEGCVDVAGVSACGSVGTGVPNINAVENVIPYVPVPNINLPKVKVNPGHVGLPGRGR